MRQQGCVRRDDRDARAILALVDLAGNFLAHRDSRDHELGRRPKFAWTRTPIVKERGGASFFSFISISAGGGAGAAFELITNHSGPAADAALVDGARHGRC